MLIGMLMAVLIIGLLVAGPTFENIWVAVAVYGGIILGMILAFRYSSGLAGGIANSLMGGSARGGKADMLYAEAKKCELERNYKGAVEIYRRAIKMDAKNPEPRKRMADLYLRLRKYDAAIGCMGEILDRCRGMTDGERCSLMNRMADIHLSNKRDPASAVEVLERLVEQYPKSTSALYARERIAEIRKG